MGMFEFMNFELIFGSVSGKWDLFFAIMYRSIYATYVCNDDVFVECMCVIVPRKLHYFDFNASTIINVISHFRFQFW